MNLTNIKNGLGFVDRVSLFSRMCNCTPPPGEAWHFKRIPDRDFSELALSYSYDDAGQQKDVYYKLFQIYTGDNELYLHICGLLEDIAKQFERGFEAE